MSTEQNIQTAKNGYAAFQRGDIPGILALLNDDIEWITPTIPGLPHSGTKHGHAGVLEFFQSIAQNWEFEGFEPREFIASGDSLAVVGYTRAKARKTGVTAETDWVMLWHFRNGKCARFQEFADSAALARAITASAASA